MVVAGLLVLAVALTSFAMAVWRASPGSEINRRFTAFSLLTVAWILGVAGAHLGHFLEVWVSVAFASASLLPIAFLYFIDACPPPTSSPLQRLTRPLLGFGLMFALASASTRLVVEAPALTAEGFSRQAGPFYPLFTAYIVTTWAIALAVFVIKLRQARGRARAQLQYFGVGMLLPGTGVIATNLLVPFFTGRSTYSWIGPLFAVSFIAVVGHAIVRRRLAELRLAINQTLTVAVAGAISCLPVALIFYFTHGSVLAKLSSMQALAAVGAVLAATLLVPPLRSATHTAVNRYIYRRQSNYKETVRRASELLTRVVPLRRLLPLLGELTAGAIEIEGISLYIERERNFELEFVRRSPDGAAFTAPPLPPDVVIGALLRAAEPIVADEVARETGPEARAMTEALSRLNWSLAIPVVSQNRLVGAIALGPKLSGDPFYSQDLDLLITLANQAGIAIKNAHLYDQVVLANEYIQNIVATIESGVVAITASGEIAMFNRAAERLTGLPAPAMNRSPASALPGCLGDALLASIADGEAHTHPELALPGRTGTKPVICTTSPLRDPQGAVLGAVGVFSDLTPLKELEIERRRAEKLAYFEILASGIAHEIKNPLVAIKTFAQLLPRRHDDDRFIDDFARVVTREIARMERLVERLRALSRPGERPRRTIDVRQPMRDAVEAVQPIFAEKNVTLENHLGDDPHPVMAQHDELVQIFLNLLLNAHEATPRGGCVVVTLTAEAGCVSLSVADTGSGIPDGSLERLFDPFFTTKPHGSGLGLAICAGIAQRYGARIRAANRPERGAVFRIDIPLADVPPAPLP